MAEVKEALDSANWAETIRMLRKKQEWFQPVLAEVGNLSAGYQ